MFTADNTAKHVSVDGKEEVPSCSAAANAGTGSPSYGGTPEGQAVTATAGQLGGMQLGSSSSSSDPQAGMRSRIHCFTEQAPDATIHFQIIDLGLQLYIWVAVGGAKLQNMYLAIQSKQNPVPSVATLLPDATSTAASSMAQRLARRVGRPVVCSCNLPQNSDTLQVIAERRLIQELKEMGLLTSTAAQQVAS